MVYIYKLRTPLKVQFSIWDQQKEIGKPSFWQNLTFDTHTHTKSQNIFEQKCSLRRCAGPVSWQLRVRCKKDLFPSHFAPKTSKNSYIQDCIELEIHPSLLIPSPSGRRNKKQKWPWVNTQPLQAGKFVDWQYLFASGGLQRCSNNRLTNQLASCFESGFPFKFLLSLSPVFPIQFCLSFACRWSMAYHVIIFSLFRFRLAARSRPNMWFKTN